MTDTYEWAGAVGHTWAEEWRRTDRSFRTFAPTLNTAILAHAPAGHCRIADIGCGAGATSLAIAAARPDAEVIGIDISAELVAVAGERAGDAANVTFVAGDAVEQAARLASFDLLVSRHGVMFFDDPVAAFAALRSTLVPGGALVFSCFRDRALNPWAELPAAAALGDSPPAPEAGVPGPFAFADPDRVVAILEGAGWSDIAALPVDYAYRAGEGEDPVADAVALFRRIGPTAPLIRAALPEQQPKLLERIAAAIAPYRHDDAVDFPAAAWIWTARS
jgi:SAM-dependent methyltransferase